MDLNYEAARLRTFKNWTNKYVDSAILAKTGLFYLGMDSMVQCKYCGVCLAKWRRNDDEVLEHLKYSPDCPLLRKHVTFNVPLEKVSMLDYILNNVVVDKSEAK